MSYIIISINDNYVQHDTPTHAISGYNDLTLMLQWPYPHASII